MPDPSAFDAHPLAPLAADLCDLIRAACPELVQRKKWNAPSFGPGNEDRLTLNLSRPDRVHLILHRGAKAVDTWTGRHRLPAATGLRWATDQRADITLTSLAELGAQRDALTRLCQQWIAATDPAGLVN